MNKLSLGVSCLYLGFLIALLVGFLVKPPSEIIYKYQDTIQFCNKETEEVQKTIENAEFRVLNKEDIMYGVKVKFGEKEQEVLIMDKVPSDCFLIIKKETK